MGVSFGLVGKWLRERLRRPMSFIAPYRLYSFPKSLFHADRPLATSEPVARGLFSLFRTLTGRNDIGYFLAWAKFCKICVVYFPPAFQSVQPQEPLSLAA